jgi:hypothetical protein
MRRQTMRLSAAQAALQGIVVESVKLDGKEVGHICHFIDTDLGCVKLIECDSRGRPIEFRPYPGAPVSVSLITYFGKVEVEMESGAVFTPREGDPQGQKPQKQKIVADSQVPADRFPDRSHDYPIKDIVQ